MNQNFPKDFETVRTWTWGDYAPHYEKLEQTDLNENNLDEWLKDWDGLYRTFSEFMTRLRIATSLDTNDEAATAEFQKAMSDIYPQVSSAQDRLNRKLLASGLSHDELHVTKQQLESMSEVFTEANLPLEVEITKLTQEYARIIGGQSADWEGQDTTLLQLKNHYTNPERSVREKAWRTAADCALQDREELNNIWVKLMGLRKQIYENADMSDYRAYAWKARQRLSYSPDDAIAFCEAIEQVVVPAVERLRERRRLKLGLDVLRPWDGQLEIHDPEVDLDDSPPLAPYQSEEDFLNKTQAVFDHVDAEMGGFFRTMRAEGLMDIENRKGKRGGAYCSTLPVNHRAFLFMNAVNSFSDVSAMLHEAGHAFHAFYAAERPYITPYHGIAMEIAEVASMSMELLAAPYITEAYGGYFSEKDAVRFRYEQLLRILYGWPYIAVVVLFQHWVYTNHDLATNPDECDKKWSELWLRFMKGVDHTGFEDWVATGWHRKGHIFMTPFYYIEYGMAQLGAVQVWANSLEDKQAALESYRSALKLGNSVSLAELYEAAGAKFSFNVLVFQQSIDLIEGTMNELEAYM